MKQIRIMAGMAAGMLLALALAGCGPQGGTLTLINESSYELTSPAISLGGGKEAKLAPGQWMRSNIDKNTVGATVAFSINSTDKDKVTMNLNGKNLGGTWLVTRWTSSLITVQNDEAVVVTVMNKNN